MSRPTVRRYPLEPIRALTGWSMQRITDVAACNAEERRRRLAEGVTERIADRLAVAAGLHPHVVWPEMAEHAIEDHQRTCEECGQPFQPRRSDQRYCVKECRWRKRSRENFRRRYRTDPAFREQQLQRVLDYQADERVAEVRRRKARIRYRQTNEEAA